MPVEAKELMAAYEASLDCVHCGLCLPVCPTYTVLSNETDSPRGRIYLMRALAEGRLSTDEPTLRPPIDRCLDCRACESACPSGVRYGDILEDVRAHLSEQATSASRSKALRSRALRGMLDRLVANHAGHRASMALLAFAQKARLTRLARFLPMPRWAKQSLKLLPRLPDANERAPIAPGIYQPFGELRAEVGLFTGCMMETLFGRVNRALLFVLRKNGCRVHVPEHQGCCGALHLHAGFRATARPLVDANLRAFPEHLDAIVLDSAGCGSAMREYGHWYPAAAAFSAKVIDMSAFLVELGPRPPQLPLVRAIAYDDACHLCHGQGVRSAPRVLLDSIPGIRFAHVERPEDCCGSAGIYNLLHPELAGPILERKLDDLLASGADTVVTGNPGCMLQIQAGLRGRGSEVRVLHTAEILAAAYGMQNTSGTKSDAKP